jgi:hypothetical protein
MTRRSSTGVLSHHKQAPARPTADARADAAATRGVARCTPYRRALLLPVLINATYS